MSFLFSRGFEAPVALVASYRSDDLHRRHPLRRQVADWARMAGVERIQLEPLAPRRRTPPRRPAPPRSAARGACPRHRDAGRGQRVLRRGAGRRHAGPAPGGIPEDLADVLLVRLEGLDDASVTVVRASAVAGRRVSHAALSAVVDVSSRPTSTEPCATPSRGTCWCRAATTTTSSATPCSPRRCTTTSCPVSAPALHAAYARALQEGRATGTAAELARHARLAKDYATALTASLRAGDDARGVGGAEEAAFHYLQALELWHDSRAPDGSHLDYPRLVGLVVRRPDRGRTPGPRPGRRPRAARPPAARHRRLGARPAARACSPARSR